MWTDWHPEPKMVPQSGIENCEPRKPVNESEPTAPKTSIRCTENKCSLSSPPQYSKNGTVSSAHSVAMKSTLSTSLTPARRHESIWQTSIASAWKSCLNTIRLCACSPVATPIPCGFSARRMVACPRISSGAVGSSMNLDTTASQLAFLKALTFDVKDRMDQRRVICAHAPGFDLCERRHVVDRLLHVPHLVRVNHEYRTSRTRILPCERRVICRREAAPTGTGTGKIGIARWGVPFPLWVIDYRTYQFAAA